MNLLQSSPVYEGFASMSDINFLLVKPSFFFCMFFRLLNLKNDALRKRFDGLKYDVKKCEEVVYDLTIRGLVPKEDKTE